MALMGFREYARHRGVTLHAVQLAIASSRISVSADKKIDPEVADREWAANTKPQRVDEPATAPLLDGIPLEAPADLRKEVTWSEFSPEELVAAERSIEPELPIAEEVTERPPAADNLVDGENFITAKTRRERAAADRAEFDAKNAQLEFERNRRELGESVPVSEAERLFFTYGRALLKLGDDAFLQQLGARLVGKTNLLEIRMILREGFMQEHGRITNETKAKFPTIFAHAVNSGSGSTQ